MASRSGSRIGRRKAVLGGASVALGAAPAFAAAGLVRLRLLETSDLHMFVYAYDYYHTRPDATVGLARVASLIRAARAERPNSMLFDNGDIIQGSPLGDYETQPGVLLPGQVHPMFRAMDQLGYDAATLGNHEFNYGLDFLDRALAGAAFPFVCANLDRTDGKPYLPRTIVLERVFTAEDGSRQVLRIGVIGFVPPQIMVWDRAKLAGRVGTADIVEAAVRHVPDLRARCDLLVALCHSGIQTGPRLTGDENASYHLAQVPGIDVIFTGHSHRVFPGPDYAGRRGVDAVRGTLNGVPAVMPGYWGSHLGVIDLTLVRDADRWRVADFAVEARPIYKRENGVVLALAQDDPGVLGAAASEHTATIAWVQRPAGELARPVASFFALVGDDSVVSLVNAAQLWYARSLLATTPFADLPLLSAAAPFKAGGISPQNYVDLSGGGIAVKDVADLYPFPNTLCAVRVSGAGVREWLERSAEAFNRIDPAGAPMQELIARTPSYNFDVIEGVTYRIDLAQPNRYATDGTLARPEAHRILDLRFQGAPIDPAQVFVVLTNNYRADGGGRFPGLSGGDVVVLRAPDTNRDVVQRYIQGNGRIDPRPAGTWTFAPFGRPVRVAFSSSPDGVRHLAALPALGPAPGGRDGFARYTLDLT